MKKSIGILVNSPNFSFDGQNSAVANFLNLIAEALRSSRLKVDLFPKLNSQKTIGSNSSFKKILIKSAKFILPEWTFNKKFTSFFNEVNKMNIEYANSLSEYDLIIEFCTYGSQVGANFKQKYSKPYILIFDAPLDLQFKEMYGRTGKFEADILIAEKNSLLNANVVVCYSHAVKTYLETNFANEKHLEIIPCIAWKKKIERKNSNEKFEIGFIGSFLSWHKVHLLVEAFEKIAEVNAVAELWLVGFGEEWNKIKKQVDKSRYKHRINMTGYVSEEELNKIKSFLKVGVMPGSNWYGSPLKLFEYAESGIPIIAPSTPTVNEYFRHEENALIIDSENEIASLVKHLKELLANSEKKEKLSSAGLKMMQNDFAKEKVMSKFVNIVNSILADAK